MDPVKVLRKIKQNPKKSLDNARRGVLADLMEIANVWQEAPELLSNDILGIFFHHLDANACPTEPSLARQKSTSFDRAFMSMAGLAKAAHALEMQNDDNYGDEIIKAWPGVFKWSVFFFAGRVQSATILPETRKSNLDIITAMWYSLSRSDKARQVMSATQGSIEIATKMWILEDKYPNLPSMVDIPTASAALDALLRDEPPSALARVVAAAGGNANNVAQMALSRLRTALANPRMEERRVTIYLDVIDHLSRAADHPLRHAFFNANIITECTKIALDVTKKLNEGGGPDLLNVMVAAFVYLANYLQSTDGFSWVNQSIQAGLLRAFVDGSPHYHKLVPDDCSLVLRIVRDILPKYLVYRSVIESVDRTIRKLGESPHKERIEGSLAWDVWRNFHRLALERYLVTLQATALKGKGATCDNVKCQKIDSKSNFRKCVPCQTTLYCSKECQVIAWKEGGHKTMCKLKQRERLEGKYQSISKTDAAFFHFLFTRDARSNLPRLRRLASKKYPEMTKTALVICIDYTKHPPKFSVEPLDDYEKNMPQTNGSANAEARNDTLIERARENPGKFTLIQSKIANGQSLQMVLTVVTGSFWKDKSNPWAGDSDESEENDLYPLNDESSDSGYKGKNIDEIDMMMARMSLNSLLAKMGKPAAF